MTDPTPATRGDRARDDQILAELEDAVTRMHVVAQRPRLVFARGTRNDGARAMAWQVLFERSLKGTPGAHTGALAWRGAPAHRLAHILAHGFDTEPTLGEAWAFTRLRDAMAMGPVILVLRADRLPDDVSRALVGVLAFEEDGLQLDGVRAIAGELGLR